MNTLELKNSLIAKINEIHDRDFLLAIKTIIEAKTSKEYTSEDYNNEIRKAEEDITNNYLTSHEDIKAKMEQWKKR